MDSVSQLKAIHGAGHLDVCEKQVDVGPKFQHSKSLVGVHRLKGREAGVLNDIDGTHAQQHLVLDNKDGRFRAEGSIAMVFGTFWKQDRSVLHV